MRALVLAREVGAITNQDYRQINGVHTLAASNALRHLRDLGLLTMKGSGCETYYQLVPQIVENSNPTTLGNAEEKTPYISGSPEELTPYTNPLYKGLDAIPKGFPSLPEDLKHKIVHLKMRSAKEEIEDIILRLCSLGPLQPVQMGKILGRDAQYLRIKFLSEMIKARRLVYQHPDKPAHPQQAYKAPRLDKEPQFSLTT
jgi:ATP-dependent DNA helicase RecG